jgi:hypothetical protein
MNDDAGSPFGPAFLSSLQTSDPNTYPRWDALPDQSTETPESELGTWPAGSLTISGISQQQHVSSCGELGAHGINACGMPAYHSFAIKVRGLLSFDEGLFSGYLMGIESCGVH